MKSLRQIIKNNHVYSRKYVGPLQAAILDWSGTCCDAYVISPSRVFCDVFEEAGVPISMKNARLPMGLRKDLHIQEILKIPEVKKDWTNIKGQEPTQRDGDKLFERFVPLQLACLKNYTKLLPGTAFTVCKLREDYNLLIGSTTGFTEEMVTILLEDANNQGYMPDSSVSGDSVKNGARPGPHMIYKNLDNLGITEVQSVLKVDDTITGVEEGLNAGCWTCAISRYSNYMDIDSIEHEQSLSKEEIEYKHKISRDSLLKSGAHYVIDSLVDIPDVVEHINLRLKQGEQP